MLPSRIASAAAVSIDTSDGAWLSMGTCDHRPWLGREFVSMLAVRSPPLRYVTEWLPVATRCLCEVMADDDDDELHASDTGGGTTSACGTESGESGVDAEARIGGGWNSVGALRSPAVPRQGAGKV